MATIVALGLNTALVAHDQSGFDTLPRVQSWLSAERVRARTLDRLWDVAVCWQAETASSTGSSLVVRSTLRARSETFWRLCVDTLDGGEGGVSQFVDYAWTPALAWKMTPAWLVLFDPSKPMPEGHPIDVVGDNAAKAASLMLYGGLHLIAHEGFDGSTLTAVPNGRWRCEGASFAFEGVWSSEHGRAFVMAASIGGSQLNVGDWRHHPDLECWLAHDITIRRAGASAADSSAASLRLRLLSATPNLPDEAETMVMQPDFNSIDVYRGPVQIVSITDYIRNTESISTPHGIQTVPMEEVRRLEAAPLRALKILGWCFALLPLLTLPWIKLFRLFYPPGDLL